MEYIISYHTDIGTKKKTNQDSLLMQVADSARGQVAFAVICDGMGGLEKGEVASKEVIVKLSEWFQYVLPSLLEEDDFPQKLRNQWIEILEQENRKLYEYGKRTNINLGTTATGILIVDKNYYIIHVGDSRLYELSDKLYQITKDQTVIAREIERGNLTPEAAKFDDRRNVLLECVGVTKDIAPEFGIGDVKSGAVYLLCSDGFRHEITTEEIWENLQPNKESSEIMKQQLVKLIELNKSRGEKDNITALMIKVK